MPRQKKPLTVKQLIEILEEAEPEMPVYFFASDDVDLSGVGFDDTYKPLTEDCIDLTMTDQVDINVTNT